MREQRAFREMTEALRRVRGDPAPSGNSSVCSEAEFEMVEDEVTLKEAPWRQEQTGQTFLRAGISGISASPKCTSLSRRATDGLGWNEKRHGVHKLL